VHNRFQGECEKVSLLAGFSGDFAPFSLEEKSQPRGIPHMQLRLALVLVALLRLQDGGVEVPAKVLEEYAGTYGLSPTRALFVTVQEGHLFGQATGTSKFPMPARSQTKFAVPPVSAEIEFLRDESGAVTKLLFRQGGRDQIVQRLYERKQVALPEQALQRYAGRYGLPRPGFEFVINVGEGHLIAESIGQFRYPLFAESETNFFFKDIDAQIEFRKDAGGRVTSLILHRGSVTETAERK
jgi:hypothetical protein